MLQVEHLGFSDGAAGRAASPGWFSNRTTRPPAKTGSACGLADIRDRIDGALPAAAPHEEAHLVENEWLQGELSSEADFAVLSREGRADE